MGVRKERRLTVFQNGLDLKVIQITQAAYDALATKDAQTLYIIVG